MIALTTAWGLSREPFAQDLPVKDLFPLPGLAPFIDRFDYAVAQGLSTVITGDVGSGKSTSLRAAADRLHPSQYRVISLVATTGSLMELLRQVCIALGDPPSSNSIAKMTALVRSLFLDIRGKKQIPVLLIDEAHLLRLDVFDQLHTVAQADFDSRTLVPIVLSGQISLIDKLLFHTSKPFASRVVGRSHMEALQRDHMADYLAHHVAVAGGTSPLFAADAVTAIHQSSGGMLRRAGNLARGALMAAAIERCPIATAEHVRIASTEIL
jgi:Type II secretory pathway, component ExeA (predicted ATPase)